MKTGILFDLDGTLLDTLEDLVDATNYALAAFGHPPRTRAAHKRAKRSTSIMTRKNRKNMPVMPSGLQANRLDGNHYAEISLSCTGSR